MGNQKYSIWGLIKYLLGLFFSKKKDREESRRKKFEKAKSDVKEEFKNIDKKKEEAKQEDLEDRLNNMFD